MTDTELHGTRSFNVADAHYALGPAPVSDLSHVATIPGGLSGPVTVIRLETLRSFPLVDTLEHWSDTDDVYNLEFASKILVLGCPSPSLDIGAHAETYFLDVNDGRTALPEGPYYVLNNELYHVWRLYTDRQEAFFLATHPQSNRNDRFIPLKHVDEIERRMVAVPSRIPSFREDAPPLAGLRLTVKDNIDLKGVRTGLSSKAWLEFYGPKLENALLISRLMNAGAVVVGKTRLSQFGVLELPTTEWVDVHCPSNPRADGHLSPGGSTSGGAAALAAYDWVDVSVGTDTAGSIRNPAANSGLFAFRPSTYAVPMDNIFPLASVLDAPGFLARDMQTLLRVIKVALAQDAASEHLQPASVYVMEGYLPITPGKAAAKAIFDAFIRDLSEYTQATVTHTRLRDMLHEDYPPSEDGTDDYIQLLIDSQAVDKMKHFELAKRLAEFQQDYRQKHDHNPSFNPVIQWILDSGRETEEADYRGAVELKETIQAWFTTRIQNSIAVIPLSEPEPYYRDVYVEDPKQMKPHETVSRSFISPLTGCPEIVLPIGQVPYHSRISERQEHLPVVVAIIGPPGSDMALAQFAAHFLEQSGRCSSVRTGRDCFEPSPESCPVMVRPKQKSRSYDLLELMDFYRRMQDEPTQIPHLTLKPPDIADTMPTSLDNSELIIVREPDPLLAEDDAGFITDGISSGDETFADLDLDSVTFETPSCFTPAGD